MDPPFVLRGSCQQLQNVARQSQAGLEPHTPWLKAMRANDWANGMSPSQIIFFWSIVTSPSMMLTLTLEIVLT